MDAHPPRPVVPARPTLRYERGCEEFSRLLAFTDGVVAIALTLLVLNIDLPSPAPGRDLLDALDELDGQFLAFILSFVIIGSYWMAHHRFLSQLAAIDTTLIIWNLFYLFAIVLVPFEAEVIGLYSAEPLASAVYAGWFVMFGAISVAGYLIARRQGLLGDAPTPGAVRAQIVNRLAPAIVFLVSIPIAYLVGPTAAMLSWLAIWPLSALLGTRFKEEESPTPA